MTRSQLLGDSSFRTLFEHAPEGVMIADEEGRCLEVNAAACQMLGQERERLVGKEVFDALGGEDAPRLVDARHASPEAEWVEVWEWTVKRDGALIPFELTGKQLPGGGWQVFLRDISRRRQREQELREVTRLLDSIVENVPATIFVKSARDLRYERFNRAGEDLVGMDRHVLLGKTDQELFPKEQADLYQAADREALRKRKLVVIAEEAMRTASGTRWLYTMKMPILDGMGMPLHVLGIAVDITDRLRVERELEELRAEWASIVAHDLRQPLQSVSLSAQTLARETSDPSLRKYIERIRSEAERLNRMVGDLMDVSRLEAHRLELARRPIDVTGLVRECVDRIALEAPDRRIDVAVEGDVPDVYADPDRVAQVLDNLLTNGIKYGRPGTSIGVALERENDDVAVAVSSIGEPIPEEDLPRIFDRFHRTAAAKRGGAKGAGLGLYITRSLVEAHGGRITAESTTAGTTTFRFTLPVAREPAT
jgi:PAS domain S-box-containing protein